MKKYCFEKNFCREQSNFKLIPGEMKKSANVMSLEQNDLDLISALGAPIIELDNNDFGLYYTTHQLNRENISKDFKYNIRFSKSSDLLNWTNPDLNQHEGDSNCLRLKGIPANCKTFLPAVIRVAPDDWRMFCWVQSPDVFRYVMFQSNDGLDWNAVNFDAPCLDTRIPELKSNDATSVYYDSEKGIFRLYSQWPTINYPDSGHYVEADNISGAYRIMQYRESHDGINWSQARIIMSPDKDDKKYLQFYYLNIHKVENIYWGQLGYYPVDEQTMDIELVMSYDGINWERPFKGIPFIKRNEANIISASGNMIKRGNSYLSLYTVCQHHHNGFMLGENLKSEIMLAEIPAERFAALRTSGDSGNLLTTPFVLTRRQITVNADIKGQLKAELCDVYGKKIDGFAFENFKGFNGDFSDAQLNWTNPITDEMLYKVYTLKFNVKDGDIFSIEF